MDDELVSQRRGATGRVARGRVARAVPAMAAVIVLGGCWANTAAAPSPSTAGVGSSTTAVVASASPPMATPTSPVGGLDQDVAALRAAGLDVLDLGEVGAEMALLDVTAVVPSDCGAALAAVFSPWSETHQHEGTGVVGVAADGVRVWVARPAADATLRLLAARDRLPDACGTAHVTVVTDGGHPTVPLSVQPATTVGAPRRGVAQRWSCGGRTWTEVWIRDGDVLVRVSDARNSTAGFHLAQRVVASLRGPG